ncbi:hypothetical protein TB2_034815 [Malus domestica]
MHFFAAVDHSPANTLEFELKRFNRPPPPQNQKNQKGTNFLLPLYCRSQANCWVAISLSQQNLRWNLITMLIWAVDDEEPSMSKDEDVLESSNRKEAVTYEGNSDTEPFVGMEFESEEAAKVFYDGYATQVGFIMRVDAFRRSMRDGKVVWRRLVCNKEGFRKTRAKRTENRKPRAITREGCKAMLVVKKDKSGKWIVTRFIKEHNHPLVGTPANGRRSMLLSQTPDEKDLKIRELTAELQRERKRSANYQEQLDMVLRQMEEHSNHLSRNIDAIVQSVKEIESKRVAP